MQLIQWGNDKVVLGRNQAMRMLTGVEPPKVEAQPRDGHTDDSHTRAVGQEPR